MLKRSVILMTLSVLGIVGCQQERPGGYREANPDLSSRDPRESGLGSKDLLAAADLMVADLAKDPDLNASKARWTLVVDRVENQSMDRRFDYQIFLDTLKTRLFKQTRDRIQLYENKERFYSARARELEGGRDTFGQGDGGGRPVATEQPDYWLYGKIQELPGRGVSTYRLEFTISNFTNRRQVWTNEYIVKLER